MSNIGNLSNSGLDTNAIIEKLMQVERRPLQKLKQKAADYQAKIGAIGTLVNNITNFKNAVAALKDPNIMGMAAAVSDNSFMTASASSSASAGIYNIQIKNIASEQSIYSAAFGSENSEVADLSVHSVQKIKIKVGSAEEKEITVDSSNNTLSGIRNAINNANAGVKAAIINDGAGYRLILTANSTGAANRIMIKAAEDGVNYTEAGGDIDSTGLSRLAFNAVYDSNGNVTGGIMNMSQSNPALNALLKINGLEVSRSGNAINDLITGVTLNLKRGDNYTSNISLTVSKESDTLKGKVNSFVSSYNQIMSNIKDLRGGLNKKGILGGDSVLSNLQNTIRATMTTAYGGTTLAVMGITHDKNGVLSLDPSKIDSALANNEAAVISAINQMANAVEPMLTGYINNIIPARKEGIQQAVRSIQRNEETLTKRLELTEISMRKRFINLDKLLNQLQGTSNYLTQQMDKLGNISRGR